MATIKRRPDASDESHGDNTKAPSPRKGQFRQVGSFMDAGEFKSTFPKATSPNVKTGTSSGQEQ